MKFSIVFLVLGTLICCNGKKHPKQPLNNTNTSNVKIMTLDPGHFHAALVQKTMYGKVDSTLYVYAPEGPEVIDFLNKISMYNSRDEDPTGWKVKKNIGAAYLGEMLREQPGNVMVVAGKNAKKIDYILEAVKAGINVYADKPLVINKEGYHKLLEAFKRARENDLMIYDIMTERFEATTALQKLFSTLPELFGTLQDGTTEQPAIIKESVHHFYKFVSGQPLVRPAWFFDVDQEGEGLVDVTTHLVDLVQWEAFPGQVIDSSDIEMVSAKRWPTEITLEEFQRVTGLQSFPDFLNKDIQDGRLYVYCNGELTYRIKGKLAKVSVSWDFRAPEGTTDTHYSIMRGSKSNLIIKQGATENYKPTLYIESRNDPGFEDKLKSAINGPVAALFPDTTYGRVSENSWKINIPDAFKIGHEAHFSQVTQNFLNYLENGQLPAWEVPNMITKYYTTTEALRLAKSN